MAAGATEPLDKGPKLAKGLSEFLAKILEQLLLSSWLPSAALVIGATYLFALRAELDAPTVCVGSQCTWAHTMTQAGARLAEMSFGGAVVIVAVIVVITMLTQAFTFEAIRALEGYWGANAFMRWLGRRGVNWHRARRDRLRERLSELQGQMRDGAFSAIRVRNSELAKQGDHPLLRPNELEVLLASLEGREPTVELTEEEFQRSSTFDWKAYADPQLRLQETILSKRLDSYPRTGWVMPTKLGNILRHHEQNMGVSNIESFIQDNFDVLLMALAEIRQGCSSKFPTLGGCHCSGRRVPVAA